MSNSNNEVKVNEATVVESGKPIFFYCYQKSDGEGVLDACDSLTRTEYKVVASNETHLVINSDAFESLQFAGKRTGSLQLDAGWSTAYKNDYIRGSGLMFMVYTQKELSVSEVERMIEETLYVNMHFDYDLRTAKKIYETA